MRRILGVAVLGLAAMGAIKPGRQFARAYEEVQQSGVRANIVERVALSVVVASAMPHKTPCSF